MGCAQSSATGRKAPDFSSNTTSTISNPSGDCFLREKAIATRASNGGVNARSGDSRRHDEKQHQSGRSPPDADLPINWNLKFKDLVILEHIANGGYCTVLACILNGERRAVKIPLASCSDPEGAIVDLTNEIRILKRLRHPHLCTVYGAGGWRTGGELPFLVMERLEYKNLAQQCGTDVDDSSMRAQLRQRKLRSRFPFRRRLGFGLQLADVLSYLHSESIPGGFVIHRDLKPSNIGISEAGVLKVFDFGLARIRERRDPLTDRYVVSYILECILGIKEGMPHDTGLTKMTGQTGSQRFMAPEVFDGMPYNEKADMYSFGVVLWELCALQKPFAGMSSHEHARKVFRHGMRPPLDPKWPEGLRTLVEGCWHADPDQRPAASAVVKVLAQLIQNMDYAASGTTIPSRSPSIIF